LRTKDEALFCSFRKHVFTRHNTIIIRYPIQRQSQIKRPQEIALAATERETCSSDLFREKLKAPLREPLCDTQITQVL